MSSDIDDWRANLWKPYSEVNDDYDGAVFMKPGKGIDMGVNQGDMEDCWALVAISGLAHRAPGLLRDMVLYTNDQVVLQLSAPGEHSVVQVGMYVFRFFRDGEPVVVAVDSYIPVIDLWDDGEDFIKKLGSCMDKTQSYVSMLEKVTARQPAALLILPAVGVR